MHFNSAFLRRCALLGVLSLSAAVHAQDAPAPPANAVNAAAPGQPADAAPIAGDERWNAYGQFTYIWNRKNAFSAPYTNLNGTPNSLLPGKEYSFTTSVTGFFGLKPWDGAGIYFVPEMISEKPLSDLHGLGGSIQNGELEKNGSSIPTFYRSRLFLRQTWGFGGETTQVESGPMELAHTEDSRRFVLTAGNLAVIDIFDKNAYANDVRSQFLSMAFMTHASFDFAADARGYTWGAAGEWYHDEWAVRAGRFLAPRDPNQLRLNYQIMNQYGDQVEVERGHTLRGQPGKLRVLFYRNYENMGSWDDAINALRNDPSKNAANCSSFNYGSDNAGAPDLCFARKMQTKIGLGVNLEQAINNNAGVFFRAMKSDGKTEVYSFTSADASMSVGSLVKGAAWKRPEDTVGIGYARNFLSSQHVQYLNLGGIDGFIGDGQINYKPEQTLEMFYNININRHLWFTLDYQHIANPGYNSDRGPVNIFGIRLHGEI